MDKTQELRRRIAALESRLDQTESELSYLNNLLLTCGFPNGVNTLKNAIEQLLAEVDVEDSEYPPDMPPAFE